MTWNPVGIGLEDSLITGNDEELENFYKENEDTFQGWLNDGEMMGNIADSPSALALYLWSDSGINQIANSPSSMNEVSTSQTAMNILSTSQTAMDGLCASEAAMNEVSTSDIALNAIWDSQLAWDTVKALPMPLGKFMAGRVGLDGGDYADIDDISSSQAAMDAVSTSQTAMEAVTSSTVALNSIATSSTAMNAITESDNATKSILGSETACEIISNSSPGSSIFFEDPTHRTRLLTDFETEVSSNLTAYTGLWSTGTWTDFGSDAVLSGDLLLREPMPHDFYIGDDLATFEVDKTGAISNRDGLGRVMFAGIGADGESNDNRNMVEMTFDLSGVNNLTFNFTNQEPSSGDTNNRATRVEVGGNTELDDTSSGVRRTIIDVSGYSGNTDIRFGFRHERDRGSELKVEFNEIRFS